MNARRRTWRGRMLFGAKWSGAAITLIVACVMILDWFGYATMWGDRNRIELGFAISAFEGTLSINKNDMKLSTKDYEPSTWWPSFEPLEPHEMEWFRWSIAHSGYHSSRSIDLPTWAATLAVGLPTAALCWLARRKHRSGRCPSCNYDLSGLPASSPCPECGAPTTPPH